MPVVSSNSIRIEAENQWIEIQCDEYYSLKYSHKYYGNRESHLVCLRKLEESEGRERFLNRASFQGKKCTVNLVGNGIVLQRHKVSWDRADSRLASEYDKRRVCVEDITICDLFWVIFASDVKEGLGFSLSLFLPFCFLHSWLFQHNSWGRTFFSSN